MYSINNVLMSLSGLAVGWVGEVGARSYGVRRLGVRWAELEKNLGFLRRAHGSNHSHCFTVELGARDFGSLNLSFPIYKMGLTIVPTSQVSFEGISTIS